MKGNELDFIGLNGNAVFKTLILKRDESLDSILNSDTEKFEIFSPNFSLTEKYSPVIIETLGLNRRSIFSEELESDPLPDFLLYLLSNDKHYYLIELVKRRVFSNGEEKYHILELENVKGALEEVFRGEMEKYEQEYHGSNEARLRKLQKVLERIKQVFQALVCMIN